MKRLSSVWLRLLAWIAGVIAIAGAAAYAIGGRRLFTNLLRARTRAAAMLRPPTTAEMQRGTVSDTTSVSNTAAGRIPPVTIGHIALWVGLILVVIVFLFFWTGRTRPRRAPTGTR